MPFEAVRHRDHASVQIDRLDIADEHGRPLQQRPQRADDVRDVEVAGGHLVEHRGEEKEVVAADQGDLDVRIPAQQPFEVHGGVHAAESAAEHHEYWLPSWLASAALDVRPAWRFHDRSDLLTVKPHRAAPASNRPT